MWIDFLRFTVYISLVPVLAQTWTGWLLCMRKISQLLQIYVRQSNVSVFPWVLLLRTSSLNGRPPHLSPYVDVCCPWVVWEHLEWWVAWKQVQVVIGYCKAARTKKKIFLLYIYICLHMHTWFQLWIREPTSLDHTRYSSKRQRCDVRIRLTWILSW